MENLCLNPLETALATLEGGVKKTKDKNLNVFILGIMGGIFIAMAGLGQMTVIQTMSKTLDGGLAKFMGASVFPVGLMLCIIFGGYLFTGNCLIYLSVIGKKVKLKDFIKNLVLVWVGNFVGSIFVAFVSYYSGTFKFAAMREIVDITITGKLNLSFVECIASGFLCNILVAIGVWFATSAKDLTGKMLGCWFPIMLFALSGYQHVVANMYCITVGELLFSDKVNFLESLITHFLPVTIGNFLSGGIFLPIVVYIIYIKKYL